MRSLVQTRDFQFLASVFMPAHLCTDMNILEGPFLNDSFLQMGVK